MMRPCEVIPCVDALWELIFLRKILYAACMAAACYRFIMTLSIFHTYDADHGNVVARETNSQGTDGKGLMPDVSLGLFAERCFGSRPLISPCG